MIMILPLNKYGRSYEERIQALGSHCNTVIQIDNDVSNDEETKDMGYKINKYLLTSRTNRIFDLWKDCDGGPECYFSHNPKIYEHMHNIMACWFLHTDRSNLPALIFDSGWYNVAIHVSHDTICLWQQFPPISRLIKIVINSILYSSCALVMWCCLMATEAKTSLRSSKASSTKCWSSLRSITFSLWKRLTMN